LKNRTKCHFPQKQSWKIAGALNGPTCHNQEKIATRRTQNYLHIQLLGARQIKTGKRCRNRPR
jgi:hypothetical protein